MAGCISQRVNIPRCIKICSLAHKRQPATTTDTLFLLKDCPQTEKSDKGVNKVQEEKVFSLLLGWHNARTQVLQSGVWHYLTKIWIYPLSQ